MTLVRTIYERTPFEDHADGTRTPLPNRRWWWELRWLRPHYDGFTLALVPVVRWERAGWENMWTVMWLLWGIELWWQAPMAGGK